MADPVDRWHKATTAPGGPRCAEHGLTPSAEHGTGDRWQARWRDAAGRQRKQNFARKVDAARHQASVVTDIARGKYVDPRQGKITLAEYAPGVLAASPVEMTSRAVHESHWRAHILPALGGVSLARLAAQPSLVRSFLADLTRAGLADTTVGGIRFTLSGVFRVAVADGLVNRNPCDAAKPPRKARRQVQPWTAGRVADVRAALPARYQAMVDAGAGLGLRQAEVFGLAVEDVDFLRRVVHVRRQVRYAGGRYLFAPPKYGKARDVPLAASVGNRLAAHIAAYPPGAVTLPWREPGGRDEAAALLFTGSPGRPFAASTFRYPWVAARKAAGLPMALQCEGFHALRHHFASVLLANGVDIRSLSAYLGHHDPGFTLRTYCHLMPAAGDRMRAAMDRALSPEDPPARLDDAE